MFQPGEIVHAAFPFTDLSSNKRRPCLVLAQCDSPDDFLVAFITSAGLKRPSLVRVDKLTTLHLSVISGAIGVMPDDLMRSVRQKLRLLLCPGEPADQQPSSV
jgi:mRNA interferase MazF